MQSPERLAEYLKTLKQFTLLLSQQQSFPCAAALGLRGNGAGHPQGIEADFLTFVATQRASFPDAAAAWPQGTIAADSLRYDGTCLCACAGAREYRLFLDRNCPVTLVSFVAPPDDFERIADPQALAAYVQERPHKSRPLSLSMHAHGTNVVAERRPKPSSARKAKRPLYDRPSRFKSLAWLLAGAALVVLGSRWLGLGMKQGVAVNFYGWAIVVLGCVLVVRRGLDLLFPPSKL